MPEIGSFSASADGTVLRVDCQWDAPGIVGCHWIDPDTGRFLRESPWVEAGGRGRVHFDLALPEAPGRYRFYVSGRHENGTWNYAQGGKFLMVEAEVSPEGVRVVRQETTTRGRLRRERWPGLLVDMIAAPFQAIFPNRQLILSMVRRDILSRYRGSFADAFWALLNPLLLMLTYYFVFGIVLQTRFPGDPSRHGYVLFFLAGMLPWLAMNESIARAPNTALEHRNLITKLIFPVEILPINLTIAGMATGFTALVFFLCYLAAVRGSLPVSALYLPVLLVPQFLFTAGVCYLLAAWSVFLRDLVYVIGLLLTMWFFLTPICYPETALPAVLRPYMAANPLYILVRSYRAILIEGQAPAWSLVGPLCAVALAVFYAGFSLFRRSRPSFADIL
jgi:lipopolysaccharide transport system permease protein